MKSEIKILFGDNIVKVDELQDKEYCKRGKINCKVFRRRIILTKRILLSN